MAVYGLTIFLGAFLLFQVQPVISKYILPWFGGTPSVWTTCMLFFQAVLLAGYAYAHLLSSRLKPKAQAMVHLVLTLAALLFLPGIPAETWKPNGPEDPTWRIVGLLGVTIGLPYLVLAATSPLLQHWFASTNPRQSPYRLYALSNVGSLLALASYPILFEPQFTRQAQARTWAWGVVTYGLGVALCAWRVWRAETGFALSDKSAMHPVASPQSEGAGERTRQLTPNVPVVRPPPSQGAVWSTAALWILLPACASALLLATTNKVCQEVAVVPFLWVAPLSLYLLSFIISFDSPRWYRRFSFGLALVAVLGAVCWALFHWSDISVQAQMGIYGSACFVGCMICHGELYRLKPEPQNLTKFYLLIAFGGALGGVFVGVISPAVFSDYFELQVSLMLCGLLFLVLVGRDWRSGCLGTWRWKPAWCPSWGALVCAGLGLVWVAAVVAFWVQAHSNASAIVSKTRNFYGVLTIFERTDPGLGVSFAKLVHGRTSHGLELRDPARASWPTTYYGERSGVGLAMRQLAPGPRRVGLVGLGIGTLAAYARSGDYFRLYEINPSVVELARSRFSYLKNCPAKTDVVLGDARLSLEKESPQDFDFLALDAFSSDAIPVHLLTEEAFRLYERHLKSTGILAVHVSNMSLDLEPVVGNIAVKLGYVATTVDYRPPPEKWWVCRSKWMLLTKGNAASGLDRCCADARPARVDPVRVSVWTDDFTSLLPILWRSSASQTMPSTAELELKAALDMAQRGDSPGAMKHYRAALDNEPDLAMALNNLAWILATSPEEPLRNGHEAVQYARRACELTNFRTTILVGTLAAAYAEAGQFPDAIATAEKACALASAAGDAALLQKNQQLLEQYRSGRAARE